MLSSCERRAIWRALFGALREKIWIADTVRVADVLQAAYTRTPNFADPRAGEKEDRYRAGTLHDEKQLVNGSRIFWVKISPRMALAGNRRESFALQAARGQACGFVFSVVHPLSTLARLNILISKANNVLCRHVHDPNRLSNELETHRLGRSVPRDRGSPPWHD